MALVNFTNLDFDQIKTSIKDYLRSNSNFTDYDFEGSNLSTLIDVLAYNTYISSYNANMISNEVFIDSATLRENVVSLARNIGYVPKSRTAARANISFFIDTTDFKTNPLTLTLKKGIVAKTISSFGEIDYTFSIPSDITVPVVNNIAFFENIVIYEGTFLTSNFEVLSSNPSQRFILDNANIDTSTISVLVRDTKSSTTLKKFLFSDNIINSSPTSKVFFLQEIEDQRYEIIFGDGIFGQKLENLNYVDVSYIVTNGKSGNKIGSFRFLGRVADNNNNLVTDGISLITSNIESRGGEEIESIDSIKKYAPKIYSAFNRAVTASDYEAIIPKIYPETQSVSVFGGEDLDPPQYGKVFIAIKPFYGPFVPNSIKDNLKNKLKKYSVAGIVSEIVDIKYLYLEVDVTAYYNTNLAQDSEYVKNFILDNIKTYSSSMELNKYGARFKYSKFQNIIDNSHESVTSNITKVKIRRDLKASLNQPADYEICFGNPFYTKDEYNIKSSGFKIPELSDTIYLSDFRTSDNEGEVFFFKLESETEPTIIKRNVGIVDYEKGEVRLNPLNIVSTSKTILGESFIEIEAIPKSNDVIGLQDLYLQLDINNITLNMLSDDISSGADPSGTSYTVTSSYTNGKLVRL